MDINTYQPRAAFIPLHNRTARWAVVVAHRRAGKTVAMCADLVLGARVRAPATAVCVPGAVSRPGEEGRVDVPEGADEAALEQAAERERAEGVDPQRPRR